MIKLIDLQTNKEVIGDKEAEIIVTNPKQSEFLLDVSYTKGDETSAYIQVMQSVDGENFKVLQKFIDGLNIEKIDLSENSEFIAIIPVSINLDEVKIFSHLEMPKDDNGNDTGTPGTIVVKIKSNKINY